MNRHGIPNTVRNMLEKSIAFNCGTVFVCLLNKENKLHEKINNILLFKPFGKFYNFILNNMVVHLNDWFVS